MKIDYPSENQIPALKQLWEKCFPDPGSFIDGFFANGFSPEKCRCLTESGALAAALYWFDARYKDQKLAYIYAVATDPEFRGRGLCRMLMEDVHELLKHQGYAATLLLPGEPGLRRMYEKFGYRDCCEIGEFTCEAGEKIPVTEIGWEEYAAQRPSFLPEEGAEREGIRFLGTYARFYRGEDFLLAAAREEDHLIGLELLGRKEKTAGILATLNCKNGTFRHPGTGKPGAMILPLEDGVESPGYFGLTFD